MALGTGGLGRGCVEAGRSDLAKRDSARKERQRTIPFPNGWGGRRAGAGRKPVGERAGVTHHGRQPLASRFPVHVTVKLRGGLPSLRRKWAYRVVRGAIRAAQHRAGTVGKNFRVVQYSVQSNHVHFIVEAGGRLSLTRGMQGLSIRIARRLNRLWDRSGRVFSDRYHDHILRSPREVRLALQYVLRNSERHGARYPGDVDPFSSGNSFDGWRGSKRGATECIASPGVAVVKAVTWLLRIGWRRCGLIPVAADSG